MIRADGATPRSEGILAYIMLQLVDVFNDACTMLEDERGETLSRDVEAIIAQRITECAKQGERDPIKLRAFALQGFIEVGEEIRAGK